MTKTEWRGQADCRETSAEIMEAIWVFAEAYGCASEAERIWAEPDETELLAIWERVTCNGLHPSSAFVWGAAGNAWAADIESGDVA